MDLDFEFAFTERTPRIVNAAKLLRSQGRKKADLFLAEGPNSVDAAIATGAAREVFVTQAGAQRFADLITAAQHLSVRVDPITDRAAKSMSDTVTPPGIFALCTPVMWPAKEVLGRRPRLVAVPVETAEPGNAGTLIRVADAVGADAVLFAGTTVDPQSPKAVRSSAGSLFHVPVARETNLQAAMDRLQAKGLNILATCADGEVSLDEADEILAQPTAWLFGNEAHGLPDELLAKATHRVRIPIRGRAESLNLATAASICLYESAKQLARAAER
ncbi:TrmH family RNA methyltransferase [Corynebacterium aquilae]|uniref:RNA methyltransferase n=1 Tax=Corynebacterium aquilae DSM 44791 TaxID=1431546 RepID=A0A1L7CFP1_9CORY|nr:RNA methyltransferase [Corynebacterium aquilae]APT84672.1 RNA methyltransferase [Corynebacterium aquilae DSM 44791]